MLEKYFHTAHIHRFIHNKYNELVISNTLRTFAISLISLFLPIYLLDLGYSIITIIIFEILLLFAITITHFQTIRLMKYGVRKIMIGSYIISIMFYVLLYNSAFLIDSLSRIGFLVIIGVFNVISLSLFWMSFHLYFLKSTKKNTGKKIGFLPVFFFVDLRK